MSAPNDHVDALLDDYLHRLLGHDVTLRVARHCDGCASCRAALEAAKRRAEAVGAAPAPVPEALVQAVLERLETADRRLRRLRLRVAAAVGGVLAAAVLLLAALQWHYQTLAATPYDLAVLGQRTLLAAAPASLRVRLVNRSTGAAMAAVPVTVELLGGPAGPVQLARFDTDADGSARPRFRLPEWGDGSYRLRVTAATPGGAEVVEQPVRLRRSWRVMLSSDKPVYQPGQTIRLRALALRRPDLRPVAGEPATFTVSDPKGNVVFKERRPTSKYGITSADCELAGEIIEGNYSVACTVGDTPTRLAVEVRRYVLPKFKLDVQPDKPFYAPGETTRVTVQASYFFGQPVAGATLAVEMRTADEGTKLAAQEVRTDARGHAALSFTLPRHPAAVSRVTFHVSATDTAGQTQTREVTRVVTAQPLRVEVLPEAGAIVAGVSNRVYVLTAYADGSPARTTVKVSDIPGAFRLGPKSAPADNPGELVTDEQGVTSFEITPPASTVNWTVRADDGKGATAVREGTWDWGQAWLDFLMRTDRVVYDGGATVQLTALGRGTEPVFVDVLKDDQTVLTETVEMKDGHGELDLDLPPELAGTLRLCAYRLAADGSLQRKARVLYVRPANRLRVRADFDRAEYRPGRRARLDLRLTDAHGKPAPGALSLAAVDEAVFSVLQQAPGTEQSYYTLDRKLLRPVYELYPWDPDGSRAVRAGMLETALFAATAQTESEMAGPHPLSIPVQRLPVPAGAALTSRQHTLSAFTFAPKFRDVERRREEGQKAVMVGWIVLGVCALGLLFLVVAIYARVVVLAALVLMGVTAFCTGVVYRAGRQPTGKFGTKTEAKSAGLDPWAGSLPRTTRDASEAGTVFFHLLPFDEGDSPDIYNAPRVRELFPETLLWRPEIVTDDEGRASLEIDLADSITTWRLTASAVSTDGRLGATQQPLKVFQPFFVEVNLPVALTRGDEVAVPVVVSNYLDKPQTVTVTLDDAMWCDRLDAAERRLELAAGEVRSVRYRLRARLAGTHTLQVSARGAGVADAVKRTVEVVPDGRAVERVVNGTLAAPAGVDLEVPPDAVPGSVRAVVKLYPSGFSQLVEGLDGIFRLPSGCFEQTSSTTYPNVLALDYLRRTRQSRPEVEAKARHYVHLGYQRLLGFEVAGGGFDWFGHPPANRTLTAYGLMEFEDMARVHDVDPQLIERTRRWLLVHRQMDGSWPPEGHVPLDAPAGAADPELQRLVTTAYTALAVFGGGSRQEGPPTRDYLLAHRPETIADPHALALVADALLAIDPEGRASPYLDRLDALKKASPDGRYVWWEQPAGWHTTFNGGGQCGTVETTVRATLALLHGRSHPATTRAALNWIAGQRGATGIWPSTQATVLGLKALLAGSDTAFGDRERRIEVRLGDTFRREVVVPADRAEVMQQLDLTPHLGRGTTRLTVAESSGTAASFQVAFRYHVPAAAAPAGSGPLSISVAYDRTELPVGGAVRATATATNGASVPAAMVMLELPVPAGFAPVADDFAALVAARKAAKYQVQPRCVLVYLRELAPGEPLGLTYRLTATTPAKVTAPAARVYEYYNPDRQGRGSEARFTVTGGG